VDRAEAAYSDAIRGRVDDVAFRVELGDVCADLKQWSKARAEYTWILDADMLGDGELNRRTWLRLAVLQLYFGDQDGYRRTCARLVERHGSSDDWRTIVALIRICVVGADPGLAPSRVAELSKRLAGSDPQKEVQNVTILALRLGRPDVDAPALQAALARFGWDTQRIALARVVHARGDFLGARNLMNQVRTENRRVNPMVGSTGSWVSNMETQLWYRQAEVVIQSDRWRAVDELVEQRQWSAALAALGPLLKPEDRSARDWETRARCFAELARWEEAAADFARAYSLSPDSVPVALGYASACLRLGDRDTYRRLCQKALEIHAGASRGELLNNVGWLCVLDAAAGAEAARALALLGKALSKSAGNAQLHTRACLLYRAGRHGDAVEQLNELIARPGYPANASDWLFLAMAHHRLGHMEEARKFLDQSIAWLAANDQLDWRNRAEMEHFQAEALTLIGERR
jgi:tetratricopeptide (TPR) repeat protein